MAKKAKDFFGKNITDVIDQACKFYETTQDQLDIEILETGSAGIFGLCRKQAHIRVKEKEKERAVAEEAKTAKKKKQPQEKTTEAQATPEKVKAAPAVEEKSGKEADKAPVTVEKKPTPEVLEPEREKEESELPTQEALDAIGATVKELLQLMAFPSEVEVSSKSNTVYCNISSEYEEDIIGSEGRTLDSLQYLLRKMMLQNLPDRYMLSLDVGDFRERRAEELKERALQLAAQVKEDGKTQAIPALNPSERRIVHMILQEDKSVRSRSVGDGLFKKILIYKPGKGRRSGSRKKKSN